VCVAALLLAAVIALVLLFGRPDELQQGVTAFRANRHGVAEQHFRAALQRDQGSITARLYLARILREQQRYEESANLLREAARRAPQDAAVRRELGYLFLALNRPEQAAAQFRQSVELEPDETLGWVWLVQSLRRANDPAAELWLSRAPAAAQAMLRTGRTP
jgi:tetratricopeptide (TPR) repeat protein